MLQLSAGKPFIDPATIAAQLVKTPGINFIGEPTSVLFHKNLIQSIGSFDTRLTQICDLEYWLRVSGTHGLYYIDESLTSFRIHATSTTSGNVLSKPKFRPRYIDTLLLSVKILHDPLFAHLRNNLETSEKRRLQLYAETRMLEAKDAWQKDQSVDRNLFDTLRNEAPELATIGKPGFVSRLVYILLKIRRRMR
jgi:hypothetical protein